MDETVKNLDNFVSPGRLTDPFGDQDTKTKSPASPAKFNGRYVPPKEIPDLRSMGRPTRQIPMTRTPAKQEESVYISRRSKGYLDECIKKGSLTEDEIPTILKLSDAAGKAHGRCAPSSTDVETAVEFRTPERVARVAQGEDSLMIERMDSTTSKRMSPKQLKLHWTMVAKAILEELEPKAPAPTSEEPQS